MGFMYNVSVLRARQGKITSANSVSLQFIKLFVAAKTAKKFHPLSNGGNLAQEFGESKVKTLSEKLPSDYGGKGGELKTQGAGPSLE